MFVRYGLGDALDDQIVQYQKALHDLAVSMDLARKSGNAAAVEQLRTQFDALSAEVTRLVAQKKGQESPSKLALSLADFGEAVAKNARTFSIVAGLGLVAVLVAPTLLAPRRRR
jgi:hypothetical protein